MQARDLLKSILEEDPLKSLIKYWEASLQCIMMLQITHKYGRNRCRDLYKKVELEDWVIDSVRGVEEIESRMIPNFHDCLSEEDYYFQWLWVKKKKKSDEVNYNKFSFDCVLPVVAMDQPSKNHLSCISRLNIST